MCLPLYFVFYAIKRFIVEMYRGDGNPTHQYFGVDLTTQQWFCVGMMAFGLATWYLMYRFRDRTVDTTFPKPPEPRTS
jgi:prolipoprotein diacylglyceryltransferase